MGGKMDPPCPKHNRHELKQGVTAKDAKYREGKKAGPTDCRWRGPGQENL